MRIRIWSATCAALAAGAVIGVLGQEPQTPQAPQTGASAKTITVTGCVERARQDATGTSGTTEPSARQTKFVLTNASINTTGTTGTGGSTNPPGTAVASEYRLDASDTKLTAHVGHKVEITGTVEQPMVGEPRPPAASAANAPTLKVDKVKMIASTCR